MLTQTRLDVVWSPHEGLGVRSDRWPEVPAGLARFPPLLFLPMDAPAELLLTVGRGHAYKTPANPLNPLSQWLVAHADQLAGALPVLFGQLKRAFEQRGLDGLNALLDRVAKARPDPAPPPEAYLRDDNPEGEWWTR